MKALVLTVMASMFAISLFAQKSICYYHGWKKGIRAVNLILI